MVSILLRELYYHLVIFSLWSTKFLVLIHTSWLKLLISFSEIFFICFILAWLLHLEVWLHHQDYHHQHNKLLTFATIKIYLEKGIVFILICISVFFAGITFGLIFFHSLKLIFLDYLTLIILDLLALVFGSLVFHITLFSNAFRKKIYITNFMFFKITVLNLIFAQGMFCGCYVIMGNLLTTYFFIGWSLGHLFADIYLFVYINFFYKPKLP